MKQKPVDVGIVNFYPEGFRESKPGKILCMIIPVRLFTLFCGLIFCELNERAINP